MNLFVQEAAEQDLLRQVEWYAEQGLPEIAHRSHAAVLGAIDALLAMPEERGRVVRLGAPQHRKEFSADVSRFTQNTQMLRCGS